MDDAATAELPARSSLAAGHDARRGSTVQHVSRWTYHLDVSRLRHVVYGPPLTSDCRILAGQVDDDKSDDHAAR